MKLIKSFILFFCLMLGASCTLDLREDPNAVQPSQSLASLVLNSMQRNLAGLFQTASTNGMLLTRLQNSGGTTYFNIFSPQSFDGTWSTAYSSILQDGVTLNATADANGLARHAGMSRVISAYVLMLLVDSFGDVPYTNALKGAAELNPSVDQSKDIYTAVLAMLDKAKLDLATPTVALGGYLNATAPAITDLYYANVYSKWIRLANTLKLKAYLSMRLSDPAGSTAGINAVIADPGGLIVAADQNFVFQYGINLSDPDARHPRFVANYPAGGGNYMSNWLMWHMFHGYGATQNGQPGDPRMRSYFYRQTSSNATSQNDNSCIVIPTPAHYPQSTGGGTAIFYNPTAGIPPGITSNPASPAWTRTWCFPSDRGYWGRDHVDGSGIPPDNFLRTAWGAYPAGGRYDANVNTNVSATVGMQGAGFQPIMMRSFVQFMLAESALYLGTTGVASTHFQNGIQYSMDDVRNWSVNGTFGVGAAGPNESATITAFYPTATYNTDVSNYINTAVTGALAQYTAQTGNDNKMNYIAREYWIASFGNGVEAYNLYRRTGMPTGMQPTKIATTGASPFPRSYWYPNNFAVLNSKVEQKTDLTGKIFWDKNTSNLDF